MFLSFIIKRLHICTPHIFDLINSYINLKRYIYIATNNSSTYLIFSTLICKNSDK